MENYSEYDHYEKTFKRTKTFLKRWNGGMAIMETITTSHPTLVIKIYKNGKDGWLRMSCIDPIWIKGFRIWKNCEISLKAKVELKNGEIGYILTDEKNDVEIHTSSFE